METDGRMAYKLGTEELENLENTAYLIRRLALEMICNGQWGHLGGSFSLAEIMAVLYFHTMNIRPEDPSWARRDRLVLSKAHGSPALYAAMALRGFFPVEHLYTYCELGSILEGHTDMKRTPGLESSGGPLGMGLSVAAGICLGLKLKEEPRARVFCVLGDGEVNEGNIWEAAMAASHYHLDNLIAIVDYNKVMAKGLVSDLMSIEPLAAKWSAFGWEVLEVDGHDIEELVDALYRARWIKPHGAPIVIIAHTVKGKGIETAEFNYKWHTHAPDPQTTDAMLRELSRRYGKPEAGYSRIHEPVRKETFYGGE
jgi:transketolase